MKTTHRFLAGLIVSALVAALLLASPPAVHAYACVSQATGNWSAAATWTGCNGTIPQPTDTVTVAAGHTVTLNTNATVASLTVNGALVVGNDTVVRTLTVNGDLVVGSGGTVEPGAFNATHSLLLGGNLTNDGTVRLYLGPLQNVVTTFGSTSADQTVSGSGPTYVFGPITLAKGSTSRRVVVSSSVTASSTITWTSGTWEQTAGTLTFGGTTNRTITANGALVLSGSGSAVFPSSLEVSGALTVNTTGSLTTGGGNNRLEVLSGGTATLTAGTVNIRGRLTLTAGTTTIDGATILLDPQVGTTYLAATNNVFGALAVANVSMSSGSITIVDPLNATGTGREILLASGAGTKTFSGGTIYMGDGVSGTAGSVDGFEINTGGVPLYDLTVRNQQGGTNRTVRLITSPLALSGSLAIESGGALNANGLNITLAGDWTNNGAFTHNNGAVHFNGDTVIGGASISSFFDVFMEVGCSVTAPGGAMNVAGDWTNNGAFTHNNGAVHFNGDTVIGGASISSFFDVLIEFMAMVDVGPGTLTVAGTVTNYGALRQTQGVSFGATTSFLNISADRYYGVEITPDSDDMGDTTVTVYGNQTCAQNTVNRCFHITPTNAQAATVRFYYTEGERNGESNPDMLVFHWNSVLSAWFMEGNIFSPGGAGDAQYVEATGVDEYSPFALADGFPTAVELAGFAAAPQRRAILVEWQTVSEVEVLGFDLYRAGSRDGPQTKLNAGLIPCQGPGSPTGFGYTFLDRTARIGRTYTYWLEVVDIYGGVTRFGPVSAAIALQLRAPKLAP